MLLPSLTKFIFTFSTIFLLVDVSRRPISPLHSTLNFRLQYFHAVTPSAHVYFADVPIHSSLHANSQPLSIPIAPRADGTPTICRVAETRALYARTDCGARLESGSDSPDVSKPETLLLLGKMTRNAYVEPDADGWYDLADEWEVVRSLLSSKSGFRGLMQGPDVRSTHPSAGSRMTTDPKGTFCDE